MAEQNESYTEAEDSEKASNAFDEQSQRQKKRMTLLNEALRMINDRGPSAVSLDDLAANLAISKGTVYYYFKNKDELLFECYSISFDIWQNAVDAAQSTSGTGAERLAVFLRTYLTDGLGTLRVVIDLRDQSALNGPYRDKAEVRRKGLRDSMRDLIKQGVADGSLEAIDPKIAATVLGASITWLLRAYNPGGSQSRQYYLDEAVKIVLGGLLKRA